MRVNLFNAQSPDGKTVPITVNINQLDDSTTNDGEVLWVIILSAGVLDKDTGQLVEDIVINNIQKEDILTELSSGLNEMGARINWTDLEEDLRAPVIKQMTPNLEDIEVPIDSNVTIRLRDEFPTTGIDTSSIKMYANGIEVTQDLHINTESNEASILWVPRRIK